MVVLFDIKMIIYEALNEVTGGRWITCHDFGYGRAAGVTGPHPIYLLGEV